jgi:hypothetical protein
MDPGDSAADAGAGETKPKTAATRTAIMKPTFTLLTQLKYRNLGVLATDFSQRMYAIDSFSAFPRSTLVLSGQYALLPVEA